MTRINVGIDPKNLSDKHLLAEHREIKRIPNMVQSGKAKLVDIPEKFTLGPGHVKFFYNKLGYLLIRYCLLYNECKRRGFNVQDYSSAWTNIRQDLCGLYCENKHDTQLIINRIKEKYENKKQPN